MGLEILFLLLPVAALSGWLVGRRGRGSGGQERDCPDFSGDYYRGLNFLLNEQPDKAIEVFVHMLEVDSDTVETHFALGNLFRRRGEVDRAIRIHQNLIARPTLTREQREQALYELGIDYMRAGLLDRAESLFEELVEDGATYQSASLRQLMDLYQQEKEWRQAVAMARRLESVSGPGLRPVIAQFHCEMADAEIQAGRPDAALRLVRSAMAEDRDCVRASLLEGELELKQGNAKAAIRALNRVEQQDPVFLSEAIPLLFEAYELHGRPQEFMAHLERLMREHPLISVVLAYTDLIANQRGHEAAKTFLTEQLQRSPSVRGMARLIELELTEHADPTEEELQVLGELMARLLASKPVYKCSHCGFTGKALHWQCPSCRCWNTVQPIHGVEGE